MHVDHKGSNVYEEETFCFLRLERTGQQRRGCFQTKRSLTVEIIQHVGDSCFVILRFVIFQPSILMNTYSSVATSLSLV